MPLLLLLGHAQSVDCPHDRLISLNRDRKQPSLLDLLVSIHQHHCSVFSITMQKNENSLISLHELQWQTQPGLPLKIASHCALCLPRTVYHFLVGCKQFHHRPPTSRQVIRGQALYGLATQCYPHRGTWLHSYSWWRHRLYNLPLLIPASSSASILSTSFLLTCWLRSALH